MALFLQVAMSVWVVHDPSLLVLMLLWHELGNGHVQHVDPGLAVLQRIREELEHSVDHHQVKPELLVNLLHICNQYKFFLLMSYQCNFNLSNISIYNCHTVSLSCTWAK